MNASAAAPVVWIEGVVRPAPSLPAAWVVQTGENPANQAERSRLRRTIAGQALAAQLGCDETDIAIKHDDAGRPIPAGPKTEGLAISYATRGGIVVVALARAAIIGADIEAEDGGETPWNALHPDEARWLRREAAPSVSFTALWAAKEAAAKAWGQGLQRDPAGFAVACDGPGRWCATAAGAPDLHIATRRLETASATFWAAVAVMR